MHSHTLGAERTGATKEQIAALLDFESGPFAEKEKAALRFGLEMTRHANEISEETFRELSAYFDEGEVLEIAAVVGLFNYFNRVNEALGVEPTQPGEGVDT
jgi:alkylhydroperoxidase family enzyme